MSSSFTQRELYGGAVVADLPTDFLDASNLRPIPDHQEVYLSPTTLTSIIFEINEYQASGAVDVVHINASVTDNNNVDDNNSDNDSEDKAASTHHLLDTIAPPDTADLESIRDNPPTRVSLTDKQLAQFPSYTQSAMINIVVNNTDKSQERKNQKGEQQKIYQLLTRMKDHDTDLCVRVIVPLKELSTTTNTRTIEITEGGNHTTTTTTNTMIENEMAFAEDVLQNVIRSLQIRNFGLFGA